MIAAPVLADVKLPAIVSDNMVLQQKSNANLWGWADPGEKVTVKASWQRFFGKSTKADKDGNWKLSIKTPKAGGPYKITIKAGNAITLDNILIGEVWICSGQSNMEFGITKLDNAAEEIAKANYPNIRLFDVPMSASASPKTDVTGKWLECSPETVKTCGTHSGFSGVAYHFGRKLHKDLNVPIGLVTTNWGGTPAKSWTSGQMLLTMPDFAETVKQLNDYDKRLAQWRTKMKDFGPGTKGKWFESELDQAAWKTIKMPKRFEATEIGNFDGMVWFRKTIELGDDMAGKDMSVSLGAIDDLDITYFNGKKIGAMSVWNQARNYKIPGELVRAGKNTIAIRVHDVGGGGGFAGTAEQMYIQLGDKKISIAGNWLYKVAIAQASIPKQPTPLSAVNKWTPTSLYNAMIHPLLPLRIKGAIWYQGENDVPIAKQYQTLFPNMIKSWRNAWEIGNFPFYYVQIAPFKYRKDNSAYLREAQMMTLSTPNVGMAVTMDIGNIHDIHPKNKMDVGERLALWALAKDYGQKDIVFSGPVYKSMEIEGNKIRLSFDYIGSGLMANGGDLTHFKIAGADKQFIDAIAVIDGDTIVVASDKVTNPAAVRFAFTNTAEPNLCNKEGLPASSFRTDNW
jgi:sialate O-acetylesterase